MSLRIVFVKGADGALHRFALLRATEKAAFVCREEYYGDTVSGSREEPGIGFPLEDVFELTDNLSEGTRPDAANLRRLVDA